MNQYKYDAIMLGLEHEFKVEITSEHMNAFRKLSGDNNPLHDNEEFAKSKGYKSRVVYGMLVASFYSTLAGVYIPGENCILHEVNVKFAKPVYVGDSLTVKGRVIEKNDLFKQIVIKAYIVNEKDEKVSRGIIKAGVQDE